MQKETYGPAELTMLAKVLEEAIAAIAAEPAYLQGRNLDVIGVEVGRTIMDLYGSGETDPVALKKAVLERTGFRP